MLEVESVGECVIVSAADGTHHELTAREAFDLVTDLLKAIDGARGYGQAIRGEVAEPDRHRSRRG